ncbi:MAG: hypothetical protein HQL75_02220 [Magnetococcales bacterium]|nr:hypothetical protein [Magnetococcales bacterium]
MEKNENKDDDAGSLDLQESENKLAELRTREVEANIEMRRDLLDHVLRSHQDD